MPQDPNSFQALSVSVLQGMTLMEDFALPPPHFFEEDAPN